MAVVHAQHVARLLHLTGSSAWQHKVPFLFSPQSNVAQQDHISIGHWKGWSSTASGGSLVGTFEGGQYCPGGPATWKQGLCKESSLTCRIACLVSIDFLDPRDFTRLHFLPDSPHLLVYFGVSWHLFFFVDFYAQSCALFSPLHLGCFEERSLTVKFRCGNEELLEVTEPSRCAYEAPMALL